MIFSWNRKINEFSKTYPEIISLLEKGDVQSIDQLLWQSANRVIEYLPVVYDKVLKFKKPDNSDQSLTIHKKFDKGKYQLIIFKIPWLDNNIKYSPLIFDRSISKVVGIMLPFNELNGKLSKKENSDINSLGVEWTRFIISVQFGT